MSVEYYGFTLDPETAGGKDSPFLNNAYLRRAINYAIDRRKIVSFVLRGRATPGIYGPIPPSTPGTEPVEGYRYDPQRAQALLDSAGYPNGKGLPQLTITLSSDERIASVAEAVQAQLKAIGIDARLDQINGAQQRQARDEGKLTFWRANWMADYPHAENFLALFYSPYAAPQGPNYTRYRNASVDSLYRVALSASLSDPERSAAYQQAQRIILDDAPWVILYYSIVQRLTHRWVRGYAVDPLDRLHLVRVRKSADQS
jgi:peptide/nickel transport system substrate-binding protein